MHRTLTYILLIVISLITNMSVHASYISTANSLTVENIQDHDTASDKGFSLNTGTSTTTVGANYSGHDKRQTTKATIGNGNVQVGGKALADTDIDVNRDTNNAQEITKDHELGGLDAEVTVDHRLASEEGRDKISEDFMKTDMLREAVERMVTTERIGITDLNSEIGKQNNTYEAVKLEIAKDPILAAKLQSSDLNPEEKQHVLNQLTHTVMQELGYETEGYNNKVTANENSTRQGFYSEETGDAYINDSYIDDNGQLVETAGHEMAHAMDDRDGSNQQYSKEDRETYAHNIGEGLVDYTAMALDINGHNDGLATSNNHVGNDSALIIANNVEYSGLDKTKGDALLPEFVKDARKAVRDHQEKSQQASANLKGDGVGTALSMAAAAGDIVINVTDAAVTIVDKTTDVIGAVGLFGGDLKAEALDNIARDLSSIESAYENKQEIATAILTKLQDYPNRLAEMDPSALRSLISVAGEAAIPAAIIAKVNKADVSHGPKPDMAISDNEVGHSALDQDPVVQALREKDRQGVDPNSSDISVDNEMIGQNSATDTGIKNPEASHSNDLNIGQNNENYNQRLNQKITQRGIQKEFENEMGFQEVGAITGKRANDLGREQYGDSYIPEWNDDDIVKKGIVPSGQPEDVISRAHNNPTRPQGSYLAPTGNFKNSDGSLKQPNQIQDTLALPPQSQAASITSYKGDSDKTALLGPVGKNEWSENPDGTQIKIIEKTDRKDFHKDTVQTNDD
ncbi:hypothetical protein HF888_10205 [Bermanella marisrubri]|uniref:Putative hemagglutinin/hemolysin-related protein n=1 Tax=Bermanella marisrubri TaxID=207949 RepID=Q1N5Z4_9GAMM|nr:hypothetical protein [Bermanella marisrubri]EAT13798.1 putative hemagglutinin/hemolysin-related protein [Oceanobacter sp. RED65] [Bermanella marisrubri]QIZ84567.1 hypothetical protein HF888_10205 [Bermanella marisrubri]